MLESLITVSVSFNKVRVVIVLDKNVVRLVGCQLSRKLVALVPSKSG